MAETNKNLGANVTLGVYVNGQRISTDFMDVVGFTADDVFDEDVDHHMGPGNRVLWQRYQYTQGAFTIHETNSKVALAVDALRRISRNEFNAAGASSSAGFAGVGASITIVKYTAHTDKSGVGKEQWSSVQLVRKYASPSKGEKVSHQFAWRGLALNQPE